MNLFNPARLDLMLIALNTELSIILFLKLLFDKCHILTNFCFPILVQAQAVHAEDPDQVWPPPHIGQAPQHREEG